MVPAAWCSCAATPTITASALVGGAGQAERSSLNHFAFEVGSLDEVFRARAWLRERGVPIVFEGRRRAGCQIAIEFRDPDGNNLEIYWNIDQVGTGEPRPPGQRVAAGEDAGGRGRQPVTGQRLLRS